MQREWKKMWWYICDRISRGSLKRSDVGSVGVAIFQDEIMAVFCCKGLDEAE